MHILDNILCLPGKSLRNVGNVSCILWEKCLAFQKIILCNSGNIWCIINERFCVFKKTFGTFFQERFLAFFRERFCELQKRFCVFQQIFCVIWETHFAPFGHRNHHSNQSLTRNKRNNHHSIKRNYFA